MKPDDASAHVNHEAIYAVIYAQARNCLKAAMVEALQQAKPARGRQRTTLAGSLIVPEALHIINRFVVLCKMNGNGADAVPGSFTRQMKRLPPALRKSMTYDRHVV